MLIMILFSTLKHSLQLKWQKCKDKKNFLKNESLFTDCFFSDMELRRPPTFDGRFHIWSAFIKFAQIRKQFCQMNDNGNGHPLSCGHS